MLNRKHRSRRSRGSPAPKLLLLAWAAAAAVAQAQEAAPLAVPVPSRVPATATATSTATATTAASTAATATAIEPAAAPLAAPAARPAAAIVPAESVAATSIVVKGHYDNAIGSSDAASQGVISAALLKSRPALRPGEVLEFVPGVVVTQHSGDGKANQYFLRGFNLDHGTDFATSVAGMPVNMPSHAHGQGYTDLNFLMPELVQKIDYRKGPYFAQTGDFGSAGAADIVYVRQLEQPFAQVALGQHGYQRAVFGASTPLASSPSTTLASGPILLGALELMRNDGPWTVPEDLRKANLVLGLSDGNAAQGYTVNLLSYRARWNSTDQVPQRLVDAGTYQGRPFGPYDTLDATDGGDTGRDSLSAEWHGDDDLGRTRVAGYVIRYRLDLKSNFTYALDRPDTGDQFEQKDDRTVWGFSASRTISHTIGELDARSEVGLQLRHDRIRLGLYDTQAGRIIGVTREDRVTQTLLGLYGQTAVQFFPLLRGVFGLRADQLRAKVDALSLAANSGSRSGTQWSPKSALVIGPIAKTEFFINAGRGMHSNDARGINASVDPRTGAAVDRVPPLVSSHGWELGARTEAVPGLQSSLALWSMAFNSELLYVGDAGVTEASQGSRRRGVEFNNRWTPTPWFLFDADFAWTHARFNNGDFIPNSVDRVASVAVTLRELSGWSSSLQWRYLGAGPLLEDNSVRAHPSLTTNLRISRKLSASTELTLDVFNLLNRRVNDIQYYYESQLPGETAPVFDRHVHPAEPRSLRLTLRANF